tara:strand:- start:214 stop:372 length:159 start_codon:yes stop_codon:yes gene_type:complete
MVSKRSFIKSILGALVCINLIKTGIVFFKNKDEIVYFNEGNYTWILKKDDIA